VVVCTKRAHHRGRVFVCQFPISKLVNPQEDQVNIEEQVELLMQGTEYGDEELKKAMTNELRQRLLDAQNEGRPLRVYCGFDPTSTDLHLGHTIPMRKLRQFQDLGHDVTFLIGSYTALVGDPSDKNKARPILTEEQVNENARTYAEQAFRVLDREKTQIRYNGEWLSQLSLVDLIRLGQNFTVQQFLVRDNFAKRFEAGEPIFLHETFYALMQGYDAVAMQTDVQVGGTEQLFNIIVAGRKLQEALGQKPLVGVTMGILPGTDGVQRMSKSTGNIVPINSGAEDMYGKLMSIPDFAMGKYMRLVTRWNPHEIESIEKEIESGKLHPRDAKMRIAFEITSIFYGDAAAHKAQEAFVKMFQQKEIPDELPEYELQSGQTVLDVILETKLAASKSEARRLFDQRGVRLDGITIERGDMPFPHPGVLQVGKRKFLKVK
jgi:tyrosyl-tRNA synthetase